MLNPCPSSVQVIACSYVGADGLKYSVNLVGQPEEIQAHADKLGLTVEDKVKGIGTGKCVSKFFIPIEVDTSRLEDWVDDYIFLLLMLSELNPNSGYQGITFAEEVKLEIVRRWAKEVTPPIYSKQAMQELQVLRNQRVN